MVVSLLSVATVNSFAEENGENPVLYLEATRLRLRILLLGTNMTTTIIMIDILHH